MADKSLSLDNNDCLSDGESVVSGKSKGKSKPLTSQKAKCSAKKKSDNSKEELELLIEEKLENKLANFQSQFSGMLTDFFKNATQPVQTHENCQTLSTPPDFVPFTNPNELYFAYPAHLEQNKENVVTDEASLAARRPCSLDNVLSLHPRDSERRLLGILDSQNDKYSNISDPSELDQDKKN